MSETKWRAARCGWWFPESTAEAHSVARNEEITRLRAILANAIDPCEAATLWRAGQADNPIWRCECSRFFHDELRHVRDAVLKQEMDDRRFDDNPARQEMARRAGLAAREEQGR